MRQMFTMVIPMEHAISNNRTSQIWRRQKTKDAMRALTREAAAGRYPVGKATIWVGITKRTGTLYDPQNLGDTFKGMVDELVTMGILDEDDHRHVRGPYLWHEGTDKHLAPKTMRATVTLADYTPHPVLR